MSESDLKEIERRANAASPGPWQSFVEGRDHTSGSNFILTGPKSNRGEGIELIGATIADQDFIAATRQDVPKLINEVRALREQIANLRQKD